MSECIYIFPRFSEYVGQNLEDYIAGRPPCDLASDAHAKVHLSRLRGVLASQRPRVLSSRPRDQRP